MNERLPPKVAAMETPSREYFERRAEEERLAADQATDSRAEQVHRDLADHYLKLASGPEQSQHGEGVAEGGILPKDFRILP